MAACTFSVPDGQSMEHVCCATLWLHRDWGLIAAHALLCGCDSCMLIEYY